jgi:glycosyltransferase involved in cell wall biosynthesis
VATYSVDTSDHHSSTGGRILVLSPWASRWSLGGGAGVSDDYHFIDILTKRGYALDFLTPATENPPDLQFEGFRVHTYPNFFSATQGWPTPVKRCLWPALFNIVVTPRALSLARRLRPDFVLGHSHYSALPCWAVRKLVGIPGGVKLFGVMDLVHAEWPKAKYYFKNFEQIAALKIPQDIWIILDDGTEGRDAAIRHGVSAEKIRFLPNGINVEWAHQRYDRTRTREEIGAPEGAVLVLFLARLVASKRPELFIDAARRALERAHAPLFFIVAGDGPSRPPCERLVQSLGLVESVRFTGTVEHARVPRLMSASDVFVSTSRLTNVAIPTCEAMVCGLPVIGFDVGSTRHVIAHGETGLVVPDGDATALAQAIVTLAEDEPLRRRLGEEAKVRAQRDFTGWEARISEEISIIEALARDRAIRG